MAGSTVQSVRQQLGHASVCPDTLSQRAGVFTVRKGFYYRHGRSADQLAADVLAAVRGARLVEVGEVDKPFRGGASVAQSSHFYVRFTVQQELPGSCGCMQDGCTRHEARYGSEAR
jgi:hypothetical protein